MRFEPGMYDQRANQWNRRATPPNSPSQIAEGCPPIWPCRVSAMLGLFQHYTYLYIWVMSGGRRARHLLRGPAGPIGPPVYMFNNMLWVEAWAVRQLITWRVNRRFHWALQLSGNVVCSLFVQSSCLHFATCGKISTGPTHSLIK